MFRSGADDLLEQGRKEGEVKGVQQTVLLLLRDKFGRVPRSTQKVIRATADRAQVDSWARRILAAGSLEEMGIGPEA